MFSRKNLRLFYLNSAVKSDIPTRKGIDPPTSKEAPGSQGFSQGGEGGALKRTIQHFNCTLIVDMDGEKKVLLSNNHLFSPGQLHVK